MTIDLHNMTMGRHREWRRIVKRERRRRIRSQKAKQQDCNLDPTSSEYRQWLEEQESLELLVREQVEESNKKENEKWVEAERVLMEKWRKMEEHKQKLHEKWLQDQIKRKLEWELEQKKRKEEEERLRVIEENNKRKRVIFMEKLEQFLIGDSTDPPEELLISHETKPDVELCPFFSKTATCRFGDECSRNHRYPGISKVLLATNFYMHFGLDNANFNEYDTDVMLEYEDNDTYKDFREFFHDVVPEFEKFGKIMQFKVCNNLEKHLRGNTYIEYAELRCAVAAYRSLHTRWYGGRQLSLQFCQINSWKNAICGLHSRRRCPKGHACNFLHVFRNPQNLFASYESMRNQDYDRNRRILPRHWRWSESPEPELSTKRRRSNSRHRNHRDENCERVDYKRRKDRFENYKRRDRSSRSMKNSEERKK